jgi:hypothetical protein
VLALLRRLWRALADAVASWDLGNLAWTPSFPGRGRANTRRPPGTLLASRSGRHYKRVQD